MAYLRRRRRFGKRYRRRTFRKRYRRSRRLRATSNPVRSTINRNRVVNLWARNVFPQRVKVKMNYIAVFNMTAEGGVTSLQTFRGNSVYDPDQTGAGVQPSCYDDLSALYGFYTVLGSKIKVTAVNTNSLVPAMVVMYPYIAATDATSIEECALMPKARQIIINNATAGGKGTMSTYARTDLMYTGIPMADMEFQGASNANPSRQWFWLVKLRSLNGSSTANVTAYMKVTYYVIWSGRLSQEED